MAEQGKISLDEPVAPHIDNFLSNTEPSTNCQQMPDTCAKCAADPHASSCLSMQSGSGIGTECAFCYSTCYKWLPCVKLDPLTIEDIFPRQSDGSVPIREVTFRQLITMQSGVEDYYEGTDPNWLKNAVLQKPYRDVEPLEYLMHMPHSFLFAPGAEGRGAYSTNGFSLVGLALCGLFGYSDWTQLDQRALAWGNKLFADDTTTFAKRGPCLQYPNMAHQYYSNGTNQDFFDIAPSSCINSWLGGNVAMRPLDGARFAYSVFQAGLLNQSSIDQMLTFHALTDAFAAGYLAYGLGLEGTWDGVSKKGYPLQETSCGKSITVLGHGGQDYGSAAAVHGYFPDLNVGMNLAVTSGSESSPMGMNCSLSYKVQPLFTNSVKYAIFNVVAQELRPAWGDYFSCPELPLKPVDPSKCTDHATFGTFNGVPQYCSIMLPSAAATTKQSVYTLCNTWLGAYTVQDMIDVWGPQYHTKYVPPPGVDKSARAWDLCKGTCMQNGAGPCWVNSKYSRTPWCQA